MDQRALEWYAEKQKRKAEKASLSGYHFGGWARSLTPAPASLEALHAAGYPFANWKEACLAYHRPDYFYPGVNRGDFAPRVQFDVQQRYKQVQPVLRQLAGVDQQFVCNGTMGGDPRLYLPELDLLLSYPCQPAQLRLIMDKLASRAPLGRGSQVCCMDPGVGYI